MTITVVEMILLILILVGVFSIACRATRMVLRSVHDKKYRYLEKIEDIEGLGVIWMECSKGTWDDVVSGKREANKYSKYNTFKRVEL